MHAAIRRGALCLLVIGLVGGQSARASAQLFDLTGTWSGKITCKTASAGLKATIVSTPVLAVSQSGNAIGLALDFGNGTIERYTGLANPDGKKPATKGELGIIHCGTDGVAANAGSDEIGRLVAATKAAPAVKASLKGRSVFSAPPAIGTCAWTWTRTDAADPGVATSCVQ
jgi:hypothetical protein